MNNTTVTEILGNEETKELSVPASANIKTVFEPGFIKFEPNSVDTFTTTTPGILYVNNEG